MVPFNPVPWPSVLSPKVISVVNSCILPGEPKANECRNKLPIHQWPYMLAYFSLSCTPYLFK